MVTNEKRRMKKFEQSDLNVIGQISAGTPVTSAPKFKKEVSA
jgi:hypothetical protein